MEQPTDLGSSGKQLWDGVVSGRKVSKAHYGLLLNSCRIIDRLDDLSVAIATSSLTTTNSRGDEVANPLICEHRQQLLALRQVLASLGVGAIPESGSGQSSVADEIAKARAAREAKLG